MGDSAPPIPVAIWLKLHFARRGHGRQGGARQTPEGDRPRARRCPGQRQCVPGEGTGYGHRHPTIAKESDWEAKIALTVYNSFAKHARMSIRVESEWAIAK